MSAQDEAIALLRGKWVRRVEIEDGALVITVVPNRMTSRSAESKVCIGIDTSYVIPRLSIWIEE